MVTVSTTRHPRLDRLSLGEHCAYFLVTLGLMEEASIEKSNKIETLFAQDVLSTRKRCRKCDVHIAGVQDKTVQSSWCAGSEGNKPAVWISRTNVDYQMIVLPVWRPVATFAGFAAIEFQ